MGGQFSGFSSRQDRQARNMRLLTLVLLLCASMHAGARFAPATFYATGGGNAEPSIAVGDVNGDGIPDIVAANYDVPNSGDGSVAIMLGNGNGTFQAPLLYPSGGLTAVSVAIADFNGDGKLDLVVANYWSSTVGVLLGNGDGTFQAVITYASGGTTNAVATGDLNGDGKLDLVAANGNTVGVLLGNGDGTFQPVKTYNSGGVADNVPSTVVLADINGDHKLDVVAPSGCESYSRNCKSPGFVAVLLGNGDGTLQPVVLYPTGQYFTTSVAVADVNGDGKPDLIEANTCTGTSPCGSGTVDVFLGNGDGTFQPPVSYLTGGRFPAGIAVADLNGDGKPDIAVSNYGSNSIGVLLGSGDGTFQKANIYAYPKTLLFQQFVAIADVNSDGRPDILMGAVGYTATGLGVMLNTTSIATTTTVTTSVSPSIVNQPVTFTASVSSTIGRIPDGQTITFYDGTVVLGTGKTTSGMASFTTSSLSVRTHTIKARYVGHGFFKTSSGTVTQIVTVQ
jgi:FG-GAP-like repeat/Bacterial Ig-like domain (group 3)